MDVSPTVRKTPLEQQKVSSTDLDAFPSGLRTPRRRAVSFEAQKAVPSTAPDVDSLDSWADSAADLSVCWQNDTIQSGQTDQLARAAKSLRRNSGCACARVVRLATSFYGDESPCGLQRTTLQVRTSPLVAEVAGVG